MDADMSLSKTRKLLYVDDPEADTMLVSAQWYALTLVRSPRNHCLTNEGAVVGG